MKKLSDEELLNLLSNPKDVEKIICALRKRKASSKERAEKHTPVRSLHTIEVPIIHHYTCSSCGNNFQRTHLVKVMGLEEDIPMLTKAVELTTRHCSGCYSRLLELSKEELVERIIGKRYLPECQILVKEREE
jgi:hypothetical protein